MPAAAVIPAPRAYINVVAVKKPVVGFEIKACGGTSRLCGAWASVHGPYVGGIMPPHLGFALRHAGLSTGRRVHSVVRDGELGGITLHQVRPQPSL